MGQAELVIPNADLEALADEQQVVGGPGQPRDRDRRLREVRRIVNDGQPAIAPQLLTDLIHREAGGALHCDNGLLALPHVADVGGQLLTANFVAHEPMRQQPRDRVIRVPVRA